MDAHPEAAHEPRGGHPDAAEAQDAADPARQHTVGLELVELAPRQGRMLRQEALRRGQRHGEGVLRHRLGVGTAIAGDGHLGRQVAERDEVHPGRHELHEPGAAE